MGANWDAYNLPAIWSMLKQENACTGADRVLSWEGLAHDVRTQHRRLLDAKESLAAVWSPTKNASADVFLERMATLADSMQHTLTRAEDTRAGLRGVLEALSEAQMAIQPWVEVRQIASDDLIPRWADHAEDEYDEKARQAMRKAEAAIADHKTQIQAPELYDPRDARGGSGDEIPGGDTPAGSGSGSDSGSGSLGGSASTSQVRATPIPVPVPHDPPSEVRLPGRADGNGIGGVDPGPLTGGSGGTGIDLAGVLPTPSSPPGASGALVPPGALPSGAGPGAGAVPGAVIGGGGLFGLGAGAGAGVGGGGGAAPVPLGRGGSAGRQAVPVRTAMPSGTILGVPNAGAGPSTTARGGAGGRGTVGQPFGQMPPNARGRQAASDSELIQGAADQAWDVAHGADPVSAPDTRPVRHVRGRGVNGCSR